MSELRTAAARKADVLAAFERPLDLWLGSAGPDGRPHLVPVTGWWDREQVVVATLGTSRTARNLRATGLARLGIGSAEDVIVIDSTVAGSIGVEAADAPLAEGFTQAVGWDPRTVGPGWIFLRLHPVRIQAYRGYNELEGRDVMRDSRWLA